MEGFYFRDKNKDGFVTIEELAGASGKLTVEEIEAYVRTNRR